MTDHNDLRAKAEAAQEGEFPDGWVWDSWCSPAVVAYIAAASPDVVLGLLDEVAAMKALLDDKVYLAERAALAVDDENARLREALQDRVYLEERAALAVASEVAQLRETAALARKFIVMNTAYTHDQRDVTNAIDAALGDEGERDDITELHGAMPRCSCGKWTTYVGTYDADGQTVRCHGCLRAIGKCRCR